MIIFLDQLREQITRTSKADILIKKKENKNCHANLPWKYPRNCSI